MATSSNSMAFFVKTNTLLLPTDHICCTSNTFFDGSEDGTVSVMKTLESNPVHSVHVQTLIDRLYRKRSDTVRDEMF